jgi:hypothetical protein
MLSIDLMKFGKEVENLANGILGRVGNALRMIVNCKPGLTGAVIFEGKVTHDHAERELYRQFTNICGLSMDGNDLTMDFYRNGQCTGQWTCRIDTEITLQNLNIAILYFVTTYTWTALSSPLAITEAQLNNSPSLAKHIGNIALYSIPEEKPIVVNNEYQLIATIKGSTYYRFIDNLHFATYIPDATKKFTGVLGLYLHDKPLPAIQVEANSMYNLHIMLAPMLSEWLIMYWAVKTNITPLPVSGLWYTPQPTFRSQYEPVWDAIHKLTCMLERSLSDSARPTTS